MSRERFRPLSNQRNFKAGQQMSYEDVVDLRSISFKDAIDRFLAIKTTANLRKTTLTLYAKTLRYFYDWLVEFYPDVHYLDELKREHIEAYKAFLVSQVAAYTINGRIKTLKSFFNAMIDDGEIKESPATKVQFMRVNRSKIQVFTDEQVQLLLDSCDKTSWIGFRDYCFLVLALDTGMRITEMTTLNDEDIDFIARVITVKSEIAKGRVQRMVPMSAFTSKLLRELMRENKHHFKGSTSLFMTLRGIQASSNTMRKRVTEIGEMSGVDKFTEVHPHKFRHTAATSMLKSGMDIYTLSKILGHTSLEMTKRYLSMDTAAISERHDRFSPIERFRTKKKRI